MSIRTVLSFASLAAACAAFVGFGPGCSGSSNSAKSDGGASCQGAPPAVQDSTFADCSGCAASSATSCSQTTPVEACCTWMQSPNTELARGVNLHRYSSSDPTVNLGCLATPPAAGASMNVTLSGFVWLFASGLDSKGVKVEVFKEVANGGVDTTPIGSYTTSASDAADPVGMMAASWDSKCQPDGCQFRAYKIPNVPTETRLVIKTSDANNAGQWSDLYDYNIYFSDTAVQGGMVTYDASAVSVDDLPLVASTLGEMIDPTKGLLAGEVHDCADVRLQHAIVDIDQTKPKPIAYFNNDEGNPLPDPNVGIGQGTSQLGLWGALNIPPGQPIRVTAVGKYNGQTTLLGTYTVQVFPNAVTALSLRGRRPWQM